ncbi:NUP358 [Mytilus edulis]|uniref:Nuclear pore complex protein Nup153 n=1 Tax=Mytilus edulis TaxID=6550 RepID=A0A8S3UIE2_MYTED|nr:NUP358 [Mytilus edulis]
MAECAESQTTKDIMNCPICLERYTKPKYLPCLHTFCEDCILTYVTSILEKLDGKEHLNCPVCRTTVQLPKKECTPKEFVDEIPANFLIIGLLEKEKITRQEKPCMSCERLDITSNASVICIDCSDTLCDTCQKYHKANKATYDHHIIPVSQLPDDNILPKAFKNICTKHSKKFKLFCNDIDTLSHHFSQCFKDIETQYKCKLKSIENTCSSLIAKVKDLEITRKTQLAKIFDERKDTVETQMIACENHRKSIDNQKQVIDTSIGKATNVQVMIEAEKIISQVEHHKRFLADSSSKHNFKYTITVDDGNDLAKSVEQFVDSMCSLSCDCVKVPLNLVTNLNSTFMFKHFNHTPTITVKPDEHKTFCPCVLTKKSFLGDLFKPKEGAWKCDGCLVSNNGDVLKCPACGTLKPGVKKENLPKETEKSSAFGSTGGGFSFGGKGGFNFGTAGKSDTKAASGFTFPTPDSTKEKSESKPAGFTFTPTKSDAEKNKPDAAAKGFNFTLQPSATPEKGSSGFNFTLSPSKDAGPKSPPTDAEGMYMNKDGDDDHIHFEPIIELPSVVDVVTGEEDEEVLFQHRSKLFRFVDGEWKERGVGDIKISKHKESGKVRLLMRRAQIHKICLNHYLTQELELKPMPKTDGKAWIWFALDFSDGEPAMQQLAVKFKNQEIANGFKRHLTMPKAKLDSSVATQESPKRRQPKEQITMARKFFLPDHFYLYENKPSCPGCIGCEDYETGKKISPAKSRIPVKVVADTNSSNAKTNLFGQSRTSDLPKPKSESSVIGSTTVSSSSDTKGGMFGAGATEFSFSSIVKESETSSGGVFGGGGAFSFSDLAKQADSSTSPGFKVQDHTKQFSWTGTGQQLFSTGAGDGNEEGTEEADDSGYTYDPQYEPIIDLPDLVDTKTGEEDFEEMFRQRAKLFRFDKEANQWKEKGLGEMKILRHLVNSRYRLILRREQVLKLACNQWLTAEISFKPLPTSETSWCWVGQDFSDNEPVIEQLAIKFKTIELAQQFKQVIDTCQNEIRKQNSTATEKGDIKPTTVVAQPEESRTVVAQPEESRTVVTQPEDAMKNVIEEQVKVEEDEEEDDDDYTTDEDEEEILFDKRIKFFSKEEDWKAVGLGTIKVIYDEDVNGNRIMVELDNKNVVCNHLVSKELNMSIDKKDCYWSPIDFSTDEPVRRHFRSQFSSEQAAQEFQKVFEEGRQLAQESEISERDIATFPHEITFPHAHGGSSQ